MIQPINLFFFFRAIYKEYSVVGFFLWWEKILNGQIYIFKMWNHRKSESNGPKLFPTKKNASQKYPFIKSYLSDPWFRYWFVSKNTYTGLIELKWEIK